MGIRLIILLCFALIVTFFNESMANIITLYTNEIGHSKKYEEHGLELKIDETNFNDKNLFEILDALKKTQVYNNSISLRKNNFFGLEFHDSVNLKDDFYMEKSEIQFENKHTFPVILYFLLKRYALEAHFKQNKLIIYDADHISKVFMLNSNLKSAFKNRITNDTLANFFKTTWDIDPEIKVELSKSKNAFLVRSSPYNIELIENYILLHEIDKRKDDN